MIRSRPRAVGRLDLRGTDEGTGALFSYVDLEARVRKDHPLRTIRALVNEALGAMEGEIASLYSGTGRPSIAPERLLRAMLLRPLTPPEGVSGSRHRPSGRGLPPADECAGRRPDHGARLPGHDRPAAALPRLPGCRHHLGLTPTRYQSGETDIVGRISRGKLGRAAGGRGSLNLRR